MANLSALRLGKEQRVFPRVLAVAGLIGCLALAFALAPEDVGIGLAVLLTGLVFRTLRLGVRRHKKKDEG